MSIIARTARFTCPTSSGSNTITITELGGIVPKAASFRWVRASSSGSAVNHKSIGVGACDATSEWCVSLSSEHGVSTTDTGRSLYNDRVVQIVNGNHVDEAYAQFGSFATNSITLDWTIGELIPGYLVEVTLYGGDDLSVDCGFTGVNGTQNSSVTVTPGWQTNGGIFVWGRSAMDSGSESGNIEFSYGFMSYDGTTLRQTCLMHRSDTNDAAGDIKDYIADNRCAGSNLFEKFEITSVTSTQVVITTRDAASDAARDIGYLLFNTNRATSNLDFYTAILDSPTATGTVTHSDPGLRPQLVHVITCLGETINVDLDDEANENGSLGLCTFDESSEFSSVTSEEDGAATTNTISRSEAFAVFITNDTSGPLVVGAFNAFTASGFTLDYTFASITARKWPYLVLQGPEPEVPEGGSGSGMSRLQIPIGIGL